MSRISLDSHKQSTLIPGGNHPLVIWFPVASATVYNDIIKWSHCQHTAPLAYWYWSLEANNLLFILCTSQYANTKIQQITFIFANYSSERNCSTCNGRIYVCFIKLHLCKSNCLHSDLKLPLSTLTVTTYFSLQIWRLQLWQIYFLTIIIL